MTQMTFLRPSFLKSLFQSEAKVAFVLTWDQALFFLLLCFFGSRGKKSNAWYIHLIRFGNVTQVKPCRSGLRTGWVTNREHRLKGPYVVLSFLLLFCVLCGVYIVNSVLKSRFSIISASGFRKRQKQRTNMARCSSPENYYSSGRNTELKLCRLWSIYRRGNRQTKKSGFSTV